MSDHPEELKMEIIDRPQMVQAATAHLAAQVKKQAAEETVATGKPVSEATIWNRLRRRWGAQPQDRKRLGYRFMPGDAIRLEGIEPGNYETFTVERIKGDGRLRVSTVGPAPRVGWIGGQEENWFVVRAAGKCLVYLDPIDPAAVADMVEKGPALLSRTDIATNAPAPGLGFTITLESVKKTIREIDRMTALPKGMLEIPPIVTKSQEDRRYQKLNRQQARANRRWHNRIRGAAEQLWAEAKRSGRVTVCDQAAKYVARELGIKSWEEAGQ